MSLHTFKWDVISLRHLIAALQSEQEPGAGGPPVEVVIGVTSANRVTLHSKLTFHIYMQSFYMNLTTFKIIPGVAG